MRTESCRHSLAVRCRFCTDEQALRVPAEVPQTHSPGLTQASLDFFTECISDKDRELRALSQELGRLTEESRRLREELQALKRTKTKRKKR